MIWWIFVLAILTLLSYLSDVGILPFLENVRVPFLKASLLSVLLLLSVIGVLGRMMRMAKKGEKETLAKRIRELENELKISKENEE
jgi:hypothetical protein